MNLPHLFTPCKPAVLESLDQLTKYPYYIQPKFDGLRCLVTNGKFYSNTLKEFPNKHLPEHFKFLLSACPQSLLDGELIIPDKTIQDVQSVVMSQDNDPTGLKFVGFDRVLGEHSFNNTYSNRKEWLKSIELMFHDSNYTLCLSLLCSNKAEVEKEESFITDTLKMEGIIIRRPDGIYKQGRVTNKEGYFFKYKRTDDAEGRILSVKPLETNLNKQEFDERGYAKRSSMKQNKQQMDIAGSLEVIGVNGKYQDKIFFVSLGSCTIKERLWHWERREKNKDRIVTFTMAKYRGTNEAPAEARFKCFRFDV